MKKAAIFIITVYQRIVSPSLKSLLGISSFCRFSPSCSEYAKIAIAEKGVIRGIFVSAKRISRCQPLGGAMA